MFPDNVDENGLPTRNTPSQTKLTSYNGTQIPQHGVCSIKCSFGDKETDAVFYVADVEGPAICGLPTCCQLQLVELHCAISTGSSKTSFPEIKDKGDLQLLYPDRFDGIGKFEGEYHIVTDPDVTPVVHAPRKCPIHIKDDIKKELDEIGQSRSHQTGDWAHWLGLKCSLLPKIKWTLACMPRPQGS